MLVIVAIDLCLWGQFSGWRLNSPRSESEYWRVPQTVNYLRAVEHTQTPYRILTVPHRFDPAVPPVGPSVSRSTDWVLWTQPNIYMMHGLENAAGYDGLGFARYSELAGDMKLWGELSDPDRTLRSNSREVDILNVRYLLAMQTSSSSVSSTPGISAPFSFPAATTSFGKERFAEDDFRLPSLRFDGSIEFEVPPVEADTIALLTNLSWSLDLPDGTVVARVILHTDDAREFDFDLRVGDHTSEWAYDRPDIRRQIKSRRAVVATSYPLADAGSSYQGHTYVSSFKLPSPAIITSGEIRLLKSTKAPDLRLSIFRISLAKGQAAFPVRGEWIIKRTGSELIQATTRGRWHRVAELDAVTIFKNTQVLPRAWLASRVEVLNEKTMLEVIRSGRLANGDLWDPLVTGLVETPIDFDSDTKDSLAQVEITNREPNRVGVRVKSAARSLLVLSENHFPGWSVYVDGNSATLLRVDYNLRGVAVPAGEHRVEFVYRPGSVLLGLALSLSALAVLLLWLARPRFLSVP